MTVATPANWWVTGAGDGIGRALTIRLAKQGCRVYASSRRREPLDELARLFPEHIVPLPVDVGDRMAMQHVFASLDAPPASLTGIVLSAGICEYIDLPALDSASIARVMQVNFLGIVHACEVALPLLQVQARGAGSRPQIVGIGSLSSYIGFPRAEGYGASKAAMAYFLDSLRCDVQPHIDVSVVYPGFVSTRLTAANDFPMPFQWTANQAADYIMRHLGERRRELAFPWQLHWLLRVARWLPGLWYSYLVPRLARTATRAPT